MNKTLFQDSDGGPIYERESYMHKDGWYSYERGVVEGTVRVVNDRMLKAWTVTKRGLLKPQIHWISVRPETLRKDEP